MKRWIIWLMSGVALALSLAAGYFFLCPLGEIAQEEYVVLKNKIPINASTTLETIAVGKEIQNEPVTLLAFGDLLLDRYIKREIDRKGEDYTFQNIKDFLAGNDLVLANLEGSFTDFKPRKLDPNNTSFTFDPKLVSLLKDNGFNLLNLANNHVRDFGAAGFEQSRTYLDEAGISHFGDFYNEGPAVVKDIQGLKIAFIGYNEFGNPSTASTTAEIKRIKPQVDYAVVYAHWGAEYQTNFWPGSQEKGRQFIDAGADVILGSHPHVIQPIEIYKNKPIFYSLGNFVFDQIFSFDVRRGLGVKLTIEKDKVRFDLYPTEIKDFQASPADSETKTAILKKLADASVCNEEAKAQIANGSFTLNR